MTLNPVLSNTLRGGFLVLLMTFSFAACSNEDGKGATDGNGADNTFKGQELVVFSGRKQDLIGPLIEQFEKQTGAKIDVRYGKTADSAGQIIAQGDESPADVFFAQDPGYLSALGSKALLKKLPDEILNEVGESYRSGDGLWVGSSARARVMVYNPEKIDEADLPKTLKDFVNPKYKGRTGWAPTNSSMHAHLSAMRATWGEAETRNWLEALIANDVRPYKKNTPTVAAAEKGEIDFGWVNHYYLYRMRDQGSVKTAKNASFATQGDIGNLLMVAGLGITKATKNDKLAHAFVKFMISKQAQEHYTKEVWEYPTRDDVKANDVLPAISTYNAIDLDQEQLADIEATAAMLRSLQVLE